MSGPKLVLVWELGDSGFNPIDPGFGNRPIHHPGHPDHGLPSQPGTPSHPIYHPGHPDHGLPAYPDQGLPGGSGGHPSHPIHIPGVPDQGLPPGQNIPSNELPPIPVPPEYEDDLVIAVKQPGSTDWTVTAYDVSNRPDNSLPSVPAQPDNTLPPTPQPKKK
jgi:hypothetical protein